MNSTVSKSSMPRLTNKSKGNDLFVRADKQEECGRKRSAFRLMLAAAKLGDRGAQINVGNYYDDGKGVRRSRSAALYWYKRAYRRGDSSAAHNIGVLWRNEGKLRRALSWFFRAVKLGDDESNLDIGKHFVQNEKNPRKAIPYFERVTPEKWVSEAAVEEAAQLLRDAKKHLKARRTTPR
jgi:TPR repeat protein